MRHIDTIYLKRKAYLCISVLLYNSLQCLLYIEDKGVIEVLVPEVSEQHMPGIQHDYRSREHTTLQGKGRATQQAPKLGFSVLNTSDKSPEEPHQMLNYSNLVLQQTHPKPGLYEACNSR